MDAEAGVKNVKVDCVGAECCLESQSFGESVTITIFLRLVKKSDNYCAYNI